jgi:hypothetical protein
MCTSKPTFWLSCTGCFGLLFLVAAQSGLVGQEKAPTTPKQATARVEFQNIIMGELRDEAGVHLGFTNFKGSDGSMLTVLYQGFADSEAAQNYFEKQIAKASKIIKREKKLDTSGKTVGDRAEILLRLDAGKSIPAILRTDGRQFHEFYSASRESLLLLEKRYMGEGRRAGPD